MKSIFLIGGLAFSPFHILNYSGIVPTLYNPRQGTWNQETNPKNYPADSENIHPLRNNTNPIGVTNA